MAQIFRQQQCAVCGRNWLFDEDGLPAVTGSERAAAVSDLTPCTCPKCLICGGPCRQDPVEGLVHQFDPDNLHRPKVPNPFTDGQDANQSAARIVREATGD